MAKPSKPDLAIQTLISPAGFIEQRYVGRQTLSDLETSVKKLNKYVLKVRQKKRPVLILIDISQVEITFDRQIHVAGIKAMQNIKFTRGAIYGSLSAQVLINTLARVAGVHSKVRAFDTRLDAIKWLQQGGG